MSIIIDIHQAKGRFDDHCGVHKCKPALMLTAEDIAAGRAPCQVRVELWLDYQRTAGLWGAEDTDAKRLAELYAWQNVDPGSRLVKVGLAGAKA